MSVKGDDIPLRRWTSPLCKSAYILPPDGTVQCLCYTLRKEDQDNPRVRKPFKTIRPEPPTTRRLG